MRFVMFSLLCIAGCSSDPGTAGSSSDTTTTTTTSDTTSDTTTATSACDGVVAEGYTEGQIAESWSLPDSLGAMVSLWDFCGKVIFYEEGSLW